jgi:hypothetical protein
MGHYEIYNIVLIMNGPTEAIGGGRLHMVIVKWAQKDVETLYNLLNTVIIINTKYTINAISFCIFITVYINKAVFYYDTRSGLEDYLRACGQIF